MRNLQAVIIIATSGLVAGCGGGSSPMSSAEAAPVAVEQPTPVATPTPAEPKPVQADEILVIGDSITLEYRLLPYLNLAISGETSVNMLARYERDVLIYSPKIVAIMAGTNDLRLIAGATIDSVARMAEMSAAQGSCVILSTIPPINAFHGLLDETTQAAAVDGWNAQLKALAGQKGYGLADYHAVLSVRPELLYDGLHPSQEGYALMYRQLRPLIDECKREVR